MKRALHPLLLASLVTACGDASLLGPTAISYRRPRPRWRWRRLRSAMKRGPFAALLATCLTAGSASAQSSGDPPGAELPVSLTLSAVYSLSPDKNTSTYIFGGTFTYHLSPAVGVGVGVRAWWSALGRERCSAFGEEGCLMVEDVDALAGLAHATFYPFQARYLYLRLGAGAAHLREQTAPGFQIRERRTLPFTVLGGIGSDLRLAPHFFLSPTVEVIRSFNHEEALRATPSWTIQVGIGGTVG